MTRTELYNIRRDYLSKHHSYKMVHWIDFNYAILNNIMYRKRAGRGSNNTYNEAIIMADTETSKKKLQIYIIIMLLHGLYQSELSI